MKKKITCKECKNRCKMKVEIADGLVVSVKGNKCKNGEKFAIKKVKKKNKKKDKKN